MEGKKESNIEGYPSIISYECTKKIVEQMEKSICRIKIGKNQGTGFFSKAPFRKKNNMIPIFITNNHIINEEILYKKDFEFEISINKIYKKINLNDRMKYTNSEYDITIIEIKENDDIQNYLELDDIMIDNILEINNIRNYEYIGETLYTIQYPDKMLSVSFGILDDIYNEKKYNFKHKCSTKKGASGSPILNINNKIIGAHKDGCDNNYNIGIFLNYPIKEFIRFNYDKINKKFEKADLTRKSVNIKGINTISEEEYGKEEQNLSNQYEDTKIKKIQIGKNSKFSSNKKIINKSIIKKNFNFFQINTDYKCDKNKIILDTENTNNFKITSLNTNKNSPMNIKKYKEQTEDNIRMSKNRLSHRSEFNLIKTKINNILSTNCCKKNKRKVTSLSEYHRNFNVPISQKKRNDISKANENYFNLKNQKNESESNSSLNTTTKKNNNYHRNSRINNIKLNSIPQIFNKNKNHDIITPINFSNKIFQKTIRKKKYIKKCEELSKNEDEFLVDPHYMSNQPDINHRMRAILIDWLIDVHLKYKLLPQTMYITVNLIDRYLSKVEVNRYHLQLVGVTAMFLACKNEEISPPELEDFVYITDGAYVKSDVLEMETEMLSKLNFDVTFPTQWTLFEAYRKKLDLDDKTFKLAWFLLELCLIDYKILRFKMSEISASAILIAAKNNRIYKNNWLRDNIGIDEENLEECCKEIYNFHEYNASDNLQAIRKKFSLIKYGEVAKIKLC